MPKDVVGMSLQELNHFTAHKQHQADRDMSKMSMMDKDAKMEGETMKHEMGEPLSEKLAEFGEGDGF